MFFFFFFLILFDDLIERVKLYQVAIVCDFFTTAEDNILEMSDSACLQNPIL